MALPSSLTRRGLASTAAAVLALLAAGVPAATASAPPDGTEPSAEHESALESLTLPAPSLDGNLLGDPSEIDVAVQIPASYIADPIRRYPVVYFLAGYDESPTVAPIAVELDRLVAAGQSPEMILVGVSGDNALGGSFYVDSPVSGRWASAIVDDVVTAIDQRYRTLPAPESRGIAGFSMGGYGALALAMDHPDVFGAVYALSPGLFAPGGLAESQMFADPAVVADVLAGRDDLAGVAPGDVQDELKAAMGRSADARFSAAYGVAFAPDAAGPPPWFDYPYTDPAGPVDDDVWARWEAGFGGLADRVDEARDRLLALRGITIDVGRDDEYAWIPPGCEYLHSQLERAGIPHRMERYDGGHGPVAPRAGEIMLPFFAGVLDAG
jgi:enterochelin esterase-like enzyme